MRFSFENTMYMHHYYLTIGCMGKVEAVVLIHSCFQLYISYNLKAMAKHDVLTYDSVQCTGRLTQISDVPAPQVEVSNHVSG